MLLSFFLTSCCVIFHITIFACTPTQTISGLFAHARTHTGMCKLKRPANPSAHHPYYSVNRVKGHCPVKNTLRLQARRNRSQTDAHYASQHVVEVRGFSHSPAHSSLGRRGNIPCKTQTRITHVVTNACSGTDCPSLWGVTCGGLINTPDVRDIWCCGWWPAHHSPQ